MRLPLPKTCNCLLSDIGEKYQDPGFHLYFAKKEQTSQLSGLLTGKGLEEMRKRKSYYAVDTVFPVVAAIIDSSFGFVERCDLTQMNLLHTGMMSTLPFFHSGRAWVRGE